MQYARKQYLDQLIRKKEPKRIKLIDEQPWTYAGIRKTRVRNYYIYFLVDDEEMAVKVNAVIYTGCDQTKQMAERRMEER